MKQHPIQHMLGTLYAAPLRPALWDSFLSQISALCGIRKAALICHNVPQGTHRILATLGSEVAASVQTYESHYFQFDEWTLRFPKRGSRGRVIRGEEIWQESSLLKSTFYNEFLKPFDTYQMACVGYGDAPGNFEALSVYRGLNEESFTRETMALLELLVPHLDTALTLRRKLGHLEGHASDLENALDAIAPGIILLDRNGRCIFINKSAQAILDERDGLVLDQSHLSARSNSESSSLRELLASAVSGHIGKEGIACAMHLSRFSRRPLSLIVTPWRPDAVENSKRSAAILLVGDPEKETVIPAKVLSLLYGLTPAEARLALALLNGNSLAEAAELHGTSELTARTQLKTVFQKTDTRRQAELVRLLAGLQLSRALPGGRLKRASTLYEG